MINQQVTNLWAFWAILPWWSDITWKSLKKNQNINLCIIIYLLTYFLFIYLFNHVWSLFGHLPVSPTSYSFPFTQRLPSRIIRVSMCFLQDLWSHTLFNHTLLNIHHRAAQNILRKALTPSVAHQWPQLICVTLISKGGNNQFCFLWLRGMDSYSVVGIHDHQGEYYSVLLFGSHSKCFPFNVLPLESWLSSSEHLWNSIWMLHLPLGLKAQANHLVHNLRVSPMRTKNPWFMSTFL